MCVCEKSLLSALAFCLIFGEWRAGVNFIAFYTHGCRRTLARGIFN